MSIKILAVTNNLLGRGHIEAPQLLQNLSLELVRFPHLAQPPLFFTLIHALIIICRQ